MNRSPTSTEPADFRAIAAVETIDAVERALSALAAEVPVEIRLSGTSMEPLFSAGDGVLAVQVNGATRLWPGDILLFRNSQNQLVTHRLLGPIPTRGGWRFVLRGDAAKLPDGVVERARIRGRVVGVRRGSDEVARRLTPRWIDRFRSAGALVRYALRRR